MKVLPGVSIVICTRNGAARLPQTLAALAAQRTSSGSYWEVLIINNASTDNTVTLTRELWPSGALAPLRIVDEPVLGLSYARQRAFQEARCEIISFIDDDNWVGHDWVENVIAIFAAHPEVGACGGPSHGAYETPPPTWFESLQGYYAIGAQHSRTGDITDQPGTLLWGAGLCIRRSALDFLGTRGFHFQGSGRSGSQMMSGEDTELCFALRAAGWRLWYDDRLTLKHFMPTNRLTWDYARRLVHGLGRSSVIVDIYGIALAPAPHGAWEQFRLSWLFQLAKCLKNLAKRFLTHPRACFLHEEGSRTAISYDLLAGRLSALLQLRSIFQRLVTEIRAAKWNRQSHATQ